MLLLAKLSLQRPPTRAIRPIRRKRLLLTRLPCGSAQYDLHRYRRHGYGDADQRRLPLITVSPDVPVEIYVESTDYAAGGDPNGVPSVATIPVSNGGGSGVFYDLAIVQDVDGTPTNVATTLLGDRVHHRSVHR